MKKLLLFLRARLGICLHDWTWWEDMPHAPEMLQEKACRICGLKKTRLK